MEFEVVAMPSAKLAKLEEKDGLYKVEVVAHPEGKKRGSVQLTDEFGVTETVSIRGAEFANLDTVIAQCPIGIKTPAVKVTEGKVTFGLTKA